MTVRSGYELADRGQLGAGRVRPGADPLPEVGGELLEGEVLRAMINLHSHSVAGDPISKQYLPWEGTGGYGWSMTHSSSPEPPPPRIGDVIAQYGARWRIEGIVAEDARFTAQRRGLNGRRSGPLLRAADVEHLSKLLADADRSVRNSSAG